MRMIALLFSLTTTASAADITLTHQARLLDSVGTPIHSAVDIRVQLLSASSANPSDVLWDGTFAEQTPSDGYVSLVLGVDDDGDAVDSGWMASDVWVRTLVDGSPIGAPQALTSTPRAGFSAQSAVAASADRAASVDVVASATGACTTGRIVFDIAAQLLTVCDQTGTWRTLPADLLDGDDDTTYSAGTGTMLSGTTFSVDTTRVPTASSYNHTIAVRSKGNDSAAGGRSVRVNGSLANNTSRSYGLTTIRLSDGVVTFADTFDLYGVASEAARLETVLNSYGTDHLIIVNTYDEPQRNHLLGGLPAAMYRCGATSAVYGASMTVRSAYLLVGICGYGQGSGVELYSGDQDSDPTAALDYGFELRDGVWLR